MSTRWIRRIAVTVACLTGVALSTAMPSVAAADGSARHVAQADSSALSATTNMDWSTIKALLTVMITTAKYHDVNNAIADGFVSGPVNEGVCVQNETGVRGYHYSSMPRLLAPLDLRKPAVLVYQPNGRGGVKLVAVEWYATDDDQNMETDHDRPYVGSQPFVGPEPAYIEGMPVHYYAIAWVWQYNPDGVFADFNPAGSCEV